MGNCACQTWYPIILLWTIRIIKPWNPLSSELAYVCSVLNEMLLLIFDNINLLQGKTSKRKIQT